MAGAEERMQRERLREKEKEHQRQDPVARLKLLVVSRYHFAPLHKSKLMHLSDRLLRDASRT